MHKAMANLKSILISFLVPFPSIAFYLTLLQSLQHSPHAPPPLYKWCFDHPLLLANLRFFINIDIIFCVISFLQSNHWLIDLYWTVVPLMLVHYYSTNPSAKFNFVRSSVMILLTWVWSIRIIHNYFRRERWEWGAGDDWRFNDMRRQYGKNWCFSNLFVHYKEA